MNTAPERALRGMHFCNQQSTVQDDVVVADCILPPAPLATAPFETAAHAALRLGDTPRLRERRERLLDVMGGARE